MVTKAIKNRNGLSAPDDAAALIVYILCQAAALGVLISVIAAAAAGRGEGKAAMHILFCALSMLLVNLPYLIQKLFKVRISAFIKILVILFIFTHMILGEVYRLYDNSLVFDKILHTASGVLFAAVGYSLIGLLNKKREAGAGLSPLFVALFAFCFAITVGCLWEIYEFTADSLLGTNMQRWQDAYVSVNIDGVETLVQLYGQGSGIADTMGDIIVNAAGALPVAALCGIWCKTGSPKIKIFTMERAVPAVMPLRSSEPGFAEEKKADGAGADMGAY